MEIQPHFTVFHLLLYKETNPVPQRTEVYITHHASKSLTQQRIKKKSYVLFIRTKRAGAGVSMYTNQSLSMGEYL